jgi:branched-chain amino acid transport system substrate-binding protein
MQSFLDTFTTLGGEVTRQVKFSAAASPDFSPMVDNLRASDAEGVFIIASPRDTALIAQEISLKFWKPVLFTSSWAQGEVLFQSGGKAVEGIGTIMAFDVNDPAPDLARFITNYQKQFNAAPIFSAMEGYETMLLLAAALQKTAGNAEGLAEALIGVQDFVGLTGPVRMDKYGDALRPLVIQKAKGGRFETIDKLTPPK